MLTINGQILLPRILCKNPLTYAHLVSLLKMPDANYNFGEILLKAIGGKAAWLPAQQGNNLGKRGDLVAQSGKTILRNQVL